MDDCNHALARNPEAAKSPFIGRALAYYRLERFAEAEADAGKALAANPKSAAALYLRGLAKLGQQQDGDVDIRAARAMDFRVDELFASMGLKR